VINFRNYFKAKEKIMGNTFKKLYGKELEIVKLIHDKTDAEAEQILNDYVSQNSLYTELKYLKDNGYVSFISDLSGGIGIVRILTLCKNYFAMEEDHLKSSTPMSLTVNGSVSHSNLAMSNGNINQSLTVSTENALEIISKIRNLIPSLNNTDMENEIIDNVEQIEQEIKNSNPNKGKFQRAIKRITTILEPMANLATVSALVLHINELQNLL